MYTGRFKVRERGQQGHDWIPLTRWPSKFSQYYTVPKKTRFFRIKINFKIVCLLHQITSEGIQFKKMFPKETFPFRYTVPACTVIPPHITAVYYCTKVNLQNKGFGICQ